MKIGWIANLDAELELGSRTPSARSRVAAGWGERFVTEANAVTAPILRHTLDLDAADVVLAWCPTPAALAVAAVAGRSVAGPVPVIDVLRAVNHRRFALQEIGGLPRARFATTVEDVERALAEVPHTDWLLKRPFGFSGRDRKRVPAGPLGATERTWVEASMAAYGVGLVVEPFVSIEREFAQHGWLSGDGALLLGQPTTTVCDAAGAWQSSAAGVERLDVAERESLVEAGHAAAVALRDAGYAGPFSIDGYRWRDAVSGARRFLPCGELNARFSMGFFTGFAASAEQLIRRIGLRPRSTEFGGSGS